ncbi:hypothetical protein CMEL01_07063 [Colletotrichum melonis]|uniref:Uncharacterized protein n=1 Tax=Colletotrichum melonis TaxID=1209925 RepID=A0AAI9U137_9PEZI|nr:hypothetical protein CMEL01_07063 [Colletotrichum melonis]
MESGDVSAAEALLQPPAKRVKLSSAPDNNNKPVFGRLDVALNTDDSGDITVNISNTRRLGKPVIDHLADETFAFHGSRQQVHAMIDRILDHSNNAIITGIVSLRPDAIEAASQSKAPMTTQAVESASPAATVSENRADPKPDTSTNERPAKSATTEVEASAREGPSTSAITHQSQQTPKVATNPKSPAPQNAATKFTRGNLKIAIRDWMVTGRRITRLQTLLNSIAEAEDQDLSLEFQVVKELVSQNPDMTIEDFVCKRHKLKTTIFEFCSNKNLETVGKDWLHFTILRSMWYDTVKMMDDTRFP